MSLATERRRATRTRVIDDGLHHAGLADSGFSLDCQHRRPPIAEFADRSRRQAELGLPPTSPSAEDTPNAPPTPKASPTPAPESSQRPARQAQRWATVAGNGDRHRQ